MRPRMYWGIVWGIILVLVGAGLLLRTLGIITFEVWGLVPALLLVAVGLLILWGVLAGPQSVATEENSIPLEGAGQARIIVEHGAGRLTVGAGSRPDELLAGSFGGGLDVQARRDGDTLDVRMRPSAQNWPMAFPWHWGPGRGLEWTFNLNRDVPLTLELRTGAGESRLDLSELRVTELTLRTGASATDVTLPANAGNTRVECEAGVASVTLRVPSGVAARIRAEAGMGSVTVDRARFPRAGGYYQSPDFEQAVNKVEIRATMGLGAIAVR